VGAVGAQAHVRIARAEIALAKNDGAAALEALGGLPNGEGLPRDVLTARVLRGEALVTVGRTKEGVKELRELEASPIVDAGLRARAAAGSARAAAPEAGRRS
jgi:hypothetical protein